MGIAKFFSSQNLLNVSGILVIALVGALSAYELQSSEIWPFVAALFIFEWLSFCAFLASKKHSVQLQLFWLQAFFITILYFLVESNTIAILGIVWIVQATELFGSKRAGWLLLLGSAVFVTGQVYHIGTENIFGILVAAGLYGLFQVFALGMAQRARQESMMREETAALNRELIATRELLSQSAAQSERVRIARDLHDILGHHMTALILNLEVANHSVKGAGKEKAQEKVEQSLSLAKLLLGDIRTAVSELRDDVVIDLEQSIKKLTSGIPTLEIDVDFSSSPVINQLELAEVLLRCTQESITNIIRHSNATQCRIAVSGADGKCVLTVTDNGTTNTEIEPGNGLRGMRERVVANGGELSWERSSSGFALRIEMPSGAD